MKTILSTSHDLVKHWVRLQKDRSYRRTSNTVLVEGKNLLKDVLSRHRPLRLILIEQEKDFCQDFDGERIVVSDEVASKISAVEEPEGCFAEYALLPQTIPEKIQRALVLDGLQDPGNVGTLLRTALALNVKTVFLIEPCADPWNPKTLRAAKGAQFDLCLISGNFDTIPKQASLLVADVKGADIQTLCPPDNWFLVLGNEAHGHRVPHSRHPTFITIPMPGPMESLNVSQAGAILLYNLTNYRR